MLTYQILQPQSTPTNPPTNSLFTLPAHTPTPIPTLIPTSTTTLGLNARQIHNMGIYAERTFGCDSPEFKELLTLLTENPPPGWALQSCNKIFGGACFSNPYPIYNHSTQSVTLVSIALNLRPYPQPQQYHALVYIP